MGKKKSIAFCLFVLFALFLPFSAFAEERNAFFEEILLSDVPITYGEDLFRERILERTKGERDPIGLVLTGGSARACAHIGVLQYLEENDIIPDFIVTNSMGSIIGMLYAAGVSPTQIEELLAGIELSNLFDLTIPLRGGLLNPVGFRALLNEIVGSDFQMENTPIPVMVVDDDLVTKREVRITVGNFTDTLIGAFALPAYFDPYEYKGHLLVDGGVISLAPIAAAYEYSDTIILSTTFYDAQEMNLINPITIINVSFDIGKRQNAAREMKEYDSFIWIRCEVEDYSFMAFDKALEMAEKGYNSAKKQSEALSKLYKHGISDKFLELRASQEPKIERLKKNISYFGRTTPSRPSTNLIVDLAQYTFNDTPYYLYNSSALKLSFNYVSTAFDATASSGLGLGLFNLSDADFFWYNNLCGAYYPANQLRITGEAQLDVGRKGSGFLPSLYLRESMDYVPLPNEEKTRLMFIESFEYFDDFGKDNYNVAALFNIQADVKYKFFFGEVKGSLGYQLLGNSILFKEMINLLNASVELRFFPIKNAGFFVGGKGSTRIKLGESNLHIPLYVSDGYTTSSLGFGSECMDTQARTHLSILGVNLGYQVRNSLSIGEIVTFEGADIGLYFDAIMEDVRFGFSTGIDFGTVMTLIGLSKVPFRFRLGYEYTLDGKSAFAGSILLTKTF